MRKKLKKILVIMLITLTLFNFMIPKCNTVYAVSATDVEKGIEVILGGFVGILSWPIRILLLAVSYGMNKLGTAMAYADGRKCTRRRLCIITI